MPAVGGAGALLCSPPLGAEKLASLDWLRGFLLRELGTPDLSVSHAGVQVEAVSERLIPVAASRKMRGDMFPDVMAVDLLHP
jgi:hypothetical protein